GPPATLQADLRTAAANLLRGQPFNRVGIARRGERAALLLDSTFVEIEPFARRVQPGTRAELGGTLAAPFVSPRVVVTDPAGEPHELSTTTGRSFRVPIPLDRVGRYQIEIIGESDRGTT